VGNYYGDYNLKDSELSSHLRNYVDGLNTRFQTGIARENAYRGDLQQLCENLISNVIALNDPARVKCGAPDFILRINGADYDFGYIEAKDIDKNLDNNEYDEQFSRYRASLSNLIITNYIEFRYYQNGEFVTSAKVADIKLNKIVYRKNGLDDFKFIVSAFQTHSGQPITSAAQLASAMAGKAKLLAVVLEEALNEKEKTGDNTSLKDQYDAFKKVLIHDLNQKEFSDIYAQTVVYGLFAARLHDTDTKGFSRIKASQLIPKSNPFLRKLFQYVSGFDIDQRIEWIVDALARAFSVTDVPRILQKNEENTSQLEPLMHFYEPFLAEYDPKLRRSRGVWYTPQPVVEFIVRAIDDVLTDQMNIEGGLSNSSKIIKKIDTQVRDKKSKSGFQKHSVETHRVVILDPATGTGTFLAEAVRQIYSKFASQKGAWNDYVSKHLIPRVYGFELLMASYAMAHLKLEFLLQSTGYSSSKPDERFNIFLTNALEKHHPDAGTLFASWLSQEANEASYVKRDAPVMVVMGNPPYSAISSNMKSWIDEEIKHYMYVDGVHFAERKHWLHDDYVKFMRYSEFLIKRNLEGVLGFITNHGYIDNPSFRGMRWHLLKTFSRIYIIDLHGNAMRREVSPDGSADKNVFDIMQGVAIIIAVRDKNEKSQGELADLRHFDLWGGRESKYEYLRSNSTKSISWNELRPVAPYYFFNPKDFSNKEKYDAGVPLKDIFVSSSTGIVTMGDGFILSLDKDELENRISDFLQNSETAEELKARYSLGKNYAPWAISNKSEIELDDRNFVEISTKPFDCAWTYYDEKLIWRRRDSIMSHFIGHNNFGMAVARQCASDWRHAFVSSKPIEFNFTGTAGRYGSSTYFPLYTFVQSTDGFLRQSNISPAFLRSLKKKYARDVAPLAIFDYVYAVLNAPSFRATYNDLLKINYPQIPIANEWCDFEQIASTGQKLRDLHLLKFPVSYADEITYPETGNNLVKGFYYDSKQARIYINQTQYFSNIHPDVWEFLIGSYMPLRKWLETRQGKNLSFDEIRHFRMAASSITRTIETLSILDDQCYCLLS
jgi:type I restriction-modification system DNA methylase subunit